MVFGRGGYEHSGGPLNVSERPSEPTNLQVAFFNTQTVRLTWTPPEVDGGGPLRHYVIEMKAAGEDDYEPIGKVKAGNLSYEAIGLTEGQSYHFRVRAANAGGVSETAAELDEPVTARLPFGRPRTKKSLQTACIRFSLMQRPFLILLLLNRSFTLRQVFASPTSHGLFQFDAKYIR